MVAFQNISSFLDRQMWDFVSFLLLSAASRGISGSPSPTTSRSHLCSKLPDLPGCKVTHAIILFINILMFALFRTLHKGPQVSHQATSQQLRPMSWMELLSRTQHCPAIPRSLMTNQRLPPNLTTGQWKTPDLISVQVSWLNHKPVSLFAGLVYYYHRPHPVSLYWVHWTLVFNQAL